MRSARNASPSGKRSEPAGNTAQIRTVQLPSRGRIRSRFLGPPPCIKRRRDTSVRPRGKTPPKELRRTISAILWRHQNGAKWRSIPAELGPWWLAAQLFIRWAKQGVWERLLDLLQQRDIALGMSFIDGTNIRAHHKAAGAEKRGSTALST
jgi:transposase